MCRYDDYEIRRNSYGFSDEHGYVCDCLRSSDPFEILCPICQEYVIAKRKGEIILDETMESDDEGRAG